MALTRPIRVPEVRPAAPGGLGTSPANSGGHRELPRDTLVDTLVAATESRVQCS